ncbi:MULTISPECIES: hypothetical protein [Roseivirga]|uniref:Thiamine pyrophosphokinase n=1 Tax=Roseivirga thermotolerans TaxID=1758176 RepID=A0ABQ3IEN9_9BACT|nr:MULTISPECIES: hypothetical protein [Roseivirga]MEC7754591.1 hypothetical protein [Bacteroidota bacterium]GHE74776.1 thiamine pyrophosphokinase [Roseivirga thermotolerans]|tara:strand:+ start:3239 stop:3886 length:648 start_codon:yes stop_codon:yes gene_type:complete
MSSHHIVRDEQEPALLIDDASALRFEFVELLLEWSPKVVVTSNAVRAVLKWGVKIDTVIARPNEVEELRPSLKAQSPLQLLVFDSADLLISAFIALKDLGHNAVNVLANAFNSSCLDTIRLYADTFDSVLYYNDQKWVYSSRGVFQKWLNIGDVVAVHPVVEGTFFKTEGFYQNLENEMYLEPFELTCATNGKARVESNQRPFWLIESIKTDLYL